MRKIMMLAMLAFGLFAAVQPSQEMRNDPIPECNPCPWR